MYHEFIKKNGADSRISREILERQYLGVGKPDDIANAIAFLMSPCGPFYHRYHFASGRRHDYVLNCRGRRVRPDGGI